MKTRIIVLLLLATGTTVMAFGNVGGDRRKPPSAAELIQQLDKDEDGKISSAEFDGPSEHFTRFDSNKDGYLSQDEIPSGPPPRREQEGREELDD